MMHSALAQQVLIQECTIVMKFMWKSMAVIEKQMTTQKTKDRATQTPLKSTHSIRSCLSV